MKYLHKLVLPLVFLAALAVATPAQAHGYHHRHYYRHYSYGYPGYSYGPRYYYSGYYGPYYGGGITFAFGGHHFFHRRYWR